MSAGFRHGEQITFEELLSSIRAAVIRRTGVPRPNLRTDNSEMAAVWYEELVRHVARLTELGTTDKPKPAAEATAAAPERWPDPPDRVELNWGTNQMSDDVVNFHLTHGRAPMRSEKVMYARAALLASARSELAEARLALKHQEVIPDLERELAEARSDLRQNQEAIADERKVRRHELEKWERDLAEANARERAEREQRTAQCEELVQCNRDLAEARKEVERLRGELRKWAVTLSNATGSLTLSNATGSLQQATKGPTDER